MSAALATASRRRAAACAAQPSSRGVGHHPQVSPVSCWSRSGRPSGGPLLEIASRTSPLTTGARFLDHRREAAGARTPSVDGPRGVAQHRLETRLGPSRTRSGHITSPGRCRSPTAPRSAPAAFVVVADGGGEEQISRVASPRRASCAARWGRSPHRSERRESAARAPGGPIASASRPSEPQRLTHSDLARRRRDALESASSAFARHPSRDAARAQRLSRCRRGPGAPPAKSAAAAKRSGRSAASRRRRRSPAVRGIDDLL